MPNDNPSHGQGQEEFLLRLYVSGATPKSLKAIADMKAFCESHLKGRYTLEVIDIYQQPGLASAHDVIAVPTLIKRLPAPLRKLIGDFSKEEDVLVGLGLIPRSSRGTSAR